MSFINEVKMDDPLNEIPFNYFDEQCLMVDQKTNEAMMQSITELHQPTTLTALEAGFPINFISLQSDSDLNLFDLNDDIYTTLMSNGPVHETSVDYSLLTSSNELNCQVSVKNPSGDACVQSSTADLAANYASNGSGCNTDILDRHCGEEVKVLVPAATAATAVANPANTEIPEAKLPVSNACGGPVDKPRRRRRTAPPKEKLYMKTEPFPDQEKEKKRLNALKAKKNRMKQKDMFDSLKIENAHLQAELELSRSKILELEEIVANMQDRHQQERICLGQLRDQLTRVLEK